jgi:riboflavin kinase/FMN adenylyltransferase
VYLLDYEGDAYDAQVTIHFEHRLRSELKFDGLEALKTQMALDVAQARTLLQAQ